MRGPFFVFNGKNKVELAKCCQDCAFGDSEGCLLENCVAMISSDEALEETEEFLKERHDEKKQNKLLRYGEY